MVIRTLKQVPIMSVRFILMKQLHVGDGIILDRPVLLLEVFHNWLQGGTIRVDFEPMEVFHAGEMMIMVK